MGKTCLTGVFPTSGKSVLVTGGSGSFGRAFVRRCLDDGAEKVVVYSRDEAKQAAMRATLNDPRLRFLIGDVRDANRIMDACRGIDLVVHAAALKRVETAEADPNEAIATNVIGTQNVARACVERGVERAIFLSTDKAASPATLYGATKLAAERLWLASNVYAAGTRTRFVATRYGNVWGSTGSVVPLWKQQAAAGWITITDPTMTRFFMSMDQAIELVLRAITDGRGGEVFVPKIPALSIGELAKTVAPGARWTLVGVRPGEKLHETLVTEDESRTTYDAGDIFIIEPVARTWGEVEPLDCPKVPEGFTYRSDTAEALDLGTLQRLAA